jgi:hypothetical protein
MSSGRRNSGCKLWKWNHAAFACQKNRTPQVTPLYAGKEILTSPEYPSCSKMCPNWNAQSGIRTPALPTSMLPSRRLKKPLQTLQLSSLAPMKYTRNGVLFATARLSPFAMRSQNPYARKLLKADGVMDGTEMITRNK